MWEKEKIGESWERENFRQNPSVISGKMRKRAAECVRRDPSLLKKEEKKDYAIPLSRFPQNGIDFSLCEVILSESGIRKERKHGKISILFSLFLFHFLFCSCRIEKVRCLPRRN